MRKIIHCDCDCFYASVEIRDNAALSNLPIAVGGRPEQRGVVATCNYTARAFGIHSAMPMSLAIRNCPELIIVPPNLRKYKAESVKIRRIFHDYTNLVEPLSLDEAYLDVSDSSAAQGSATYIAQEIRQRVKDEIGITISAGIAPNKFLAKIASDWNKPDGQFTITPEQVDDFVRSLPVTKLFGVGSVTAGRMHEMHIKTCADLQQIPLTELTRNFGKFGARLYDLCRGRDARHVNTQRTRKSVSAERTYPVDLPGLKACLAALTHLVTELQGRIDRVGCRPSITQRTIKVRFVGFETTTVSSVGTETDLATYQKMLETAWQRKCKPVRLLGVGVKLAPPDTSNQLGLF